MFIEEHVLPQKDSQLDSRLNCWVFATLMILWHFPMQQLSCLQCDSQVCGPTREHCITHDKTTTTGSVSCFSSTSW